MRIAIPFLLLLAACDGTVDGPAPEGTTLQAEDPSTPAAMGRLAAAIEANPERAAELLSEAGLDVETFERRLYEIAADPEASAAFAAAR